MPFQLSFAQRAGSPVPVGAAVTRLWPLGQPLHTRTYPWRRSAELQFGALGTSRSSRFAPNWNSALRRHGREAQSPAVGCSLRRLLQAGVRRAVACLLLFATAACAATTISPVVLSGGGYGGGVGGVYGVSQTTGQPALGTGTSASYSLVTGFWPAVNSSPETESAGNTTWAGGGSLEWQINDARGTAGVDPGWDLLNISGTLTITATSGSKFTLRLATLAGSTPGSAANFHNAHLYAWPIATASGGISGFDPAAFTVDAAEFANTPLAGAFSVAQYGNSVYVVYQPTDCLAPVQPTWLGVAAESSLYMWYTNASGLKEVWETIAVNCTITAKAFDIAGKTIAAGLVMPLDRSKFALPLGTTGIELVAKKILTGSSNPGSVSTSATTFCGLYSSTDPTLVNLVVLAGGVVTQRLERVPSVERYLQVLNGRPGLRSLAVSVNGLALPLGALVDGGYAALDLESFMVEGENNTVVFTGTGDAGASAFILLTDTPASAPLPVGPRLTLSLTPGGLELSWPGDPAQWQLLTSPAVDAAWEPVLTEPTAQNGLNSVALSLGAQNQFFRLQGSPAATTTARLAGRQTSVGLSGTNSQPQMKAIYGSLTW